MKIKKLFLITILLVSTGFIFANGQNESNNPRRERWENLIESKEKITVTGALVIKNRIMPELNTGTAVYLLAVPRFAVLQLEIKDGEQVTVEGVLLKANGECPMNTLEEGEEIFVVTRAIVKGKEYDLKEAFGGTDFPRRGGPGGKNPGRHPGHFPQRGDGSCFE
ncbi:MAG: hypothetical protein JW881_05135 [Spirochaetales bacterium]|nr:hypothetical protein [Spirochaetales bacterium]